MDVNGHTIVDENTFGEVDFDQNDSPNFRWWLYLYGHDSFKMDQKLSVRNTTTGATLLTCDIRNEDKVQFWRYHTIWHEFTHAVFNIAIDRLKNLDIHSQLVLAKDPGTSGNIDKITPDGWSVLEEAFAAIPEAALEGKLTGSEPVFSPNATATPRFMKIVKIDTTPGAIQDAYCKKDTFDRLISDGINAPNVLDWRLGLRVPTAFTWGLWTALVDLGGFDTLETIFGGPPRGNDLKRHGALSQFTDRY